MTAAELDQTLAVSGLDVECAEYHGALCGWLCRTDQVPLDMGYAQGDLQGQADIVEQLRRLQQEALESLQSSDMSFAPLLPSDDQSISHRAESLGQWCQGFLYGLGGAERLNLDDCSEEMSEIVEDFTQITKAYEQTDDFDDDQLNETEMAYAELVEFVRVGVQLVFVEMRQQSKQDESDPSYAHALADRPDDASLH